MTTDPTAQATTTPAPVAVPEGGWRDGDSAVIVDAFGFTNLFRRGFSDWTGPHGVTLTDEQVDEARIVYVHAPREDAPRPQPVTAPLPSEAVEAAANVLQRHYGTEHELVGDGSEIRETCRGCGHSEVVPLADPADQWLARHQAQCVLEALLAADQRARDEGTVREEIAREIEAVRDSVTSRREEYEAAGNAPGALVALLKAESLAHAARIARGGIR